MLEDVLIIEILCTWKIYFM